MGLTIENFNKLEKVPFAKNELIKFVRGLTIKFAEFFSKYGDTSSHTAEFLGFKEPQGS